MKINSEAAPSLISDVLRAGKVPMLHASPGTGKALPNSEQVLTPFGFKNMGDLGVGNSVIGVDGLPAKIKYIAEQGIRPIYKITFRDGTSVRCDEEHLWQVKERTRKTWQLMTTHQLLQRNLTTFELDSRSKSTDGTKRYNYHIPHIQPVHFASLNGILPVHPYVMGALLGDGCLGQKSISFTNPEKRIFDKVSSLLPTGYRFSNRTWRNGAYVARIIRDGAQDTFKTFLENIDQNLTVNSIHKHIPDIYKKALLHERAALIEGLNDTDGCWKKTSKGKKLIGFDVSSQQLHVDYLFVARSLGMQFSASARETSGEISYRAFYIKDRGRNTFNSIMSIEPDGEEEATCISIDNESKLFITSGFKPTHNSDIIKQIAAKNKLLLIDFRLSQADPVDMAGFPTMNEDRSRSRYAPPEDFPIEGDKLPAGYNGWLLFLDEINSAPLSVQAASYKIVLDKQVGKHNLHSKVHIVAAGNLSTDKAIVNRMSTAMQSRLIHFELELDYKAWIEWANSNGIDFRITAFINFKPDIVSNFNPSHSDFTFACPRTWEFASDLIKDYVNIPAEKLPLLTGTIGEAAGREFYAYSQIFKQLPTLEQILANPLGIKVPDDPGTQHAISGMLGHNLKDVNANMLMPFLERLPIEFQILTLQSALKKSKALLSVASVKLWISNHSKDLF